MRTIKIKRTYRQTLSANLRLLAYSAVSRSSPNVCQRAPEVAAVVRHSPHIVSSMTAVISNNFLIVIILFCCEDLKRKKVSRGASRLCYICLAGQ